MKPTFRTFEPSSQFVGNTNVRTQVKRWVWQKGRGLYVEFKDGLTCKSDYTLNELLKAERVHETTEKCGD